MQGSRDNMSVVLVCFSNAPKVSEEAVKRDSELDKHLESRVEGKAVSLFLFCFVLFCFVFSRREGRKEKVFFFIRIFN
jgi:hypothetical protein